MSQLCLAARVFLFLSIAVPVAAGGPAPVRVSLAYVGSESDSAYLGVRQGLEEAKLQGRFLGQTYAIETVRPDAVTSTDLHGHLAIIAAVDADTLRKISARWPDHAVMNISSDDESLREACIPNLLHVIPSGRMKQDAVEQWHAKAPGAAVSAAAWHPEFMKFAGRDLNKRFRAAFNTGMDDYAWAGWASVKMISDMVARRGPESPAALLDHLKKDLAFDGQKGIDLTFRPTGQLRQPLLLSEQGKLVGEAPVRGVAPSDAALDTLGLVECPK